MAGEARSPVPGSLTMAAMKAMASRPARWDPDDGEYAEGELAHARRLQAADRQGVLPQAVAVLQQDQVLVLQLLRLDPLALAQRVARGQGGQELVVADVARLQPGGVVGQGDHRRAQRPGLQGRDQPVGQVLAQLKPALTP